MIRDRAERDEKIYGADHALSRRRIFGDSFPHIFAERSMEMIEGDPIIDREVADGPRKTFDRVRSAALKQLETAARLTRDYQPIDPHFGDVGIMMALGENFARVTEIANRSNADGRLIDARNSIQPTRDAAEGARVKCPRCGSYNVDVERARKPFTDSLAYGACNYVGPISNPNYPAPPKPTPDAVREVDKCVGGAEIGFAACPKCGATMDDECKAPRSTAKTCLDDTGLKITGELYKAVSGHTGDACLLAMIGSWGDTLDDTDILAGLHRYNEMGECFIPNASADISAPVPSPDGLGGAILSKVSTSG